MAAEDTVFFGLNLGILDGCVIRCSTAAIENWKEIRGIFKRSFTSSFHYALATVNADGTPHVTPIGSLLLDREEARGVYFEIFTSRTRKNVEANPNICVLAVNSAMGFWLKSLMKGKFVEPPGARLYGKAGPRRLATPEEIAHWHRRTGFLRRLKGYDMLWGNLTYVREVAFTRYEPVLMGRMSSPRSNKVKEKTRSSLSVKPGYARRKLE